MLVGVKLVSMLESSGFLASKKPEERERRMEGFKKCRKKESASGSLMRDHHHLKTKFEVDF